MGQTRILFWLTIILAVSCTKVEYDSIKESQLQNESSAYSEFDFKTVKEFDITIEIFNDKSAIDGVLVELYTMNPLYSNGTFNANSYSDMQFKGVTGTDGRLKCKINPPTTKDSLYIYVRHIGLMPLHSVLLDDEIISVHINVNQTNSVISKGTSLKSGTVAPTPQLINGYYVLGTWNSSGLPDYLEKENDILSTEFLNDVNASLPEGIPLPESHPQYLTGSSDANLVIVDDCEIWVTLVHEGAGWHNSLGYYTYPTGNPPKSVDDITDATIIFPDVTIANGVLSPGNKVQLYYLDKNRYTPIFPAGTSIGWFIVAQGWNGSNVGSGKYIHYSNTNLNVEAETSLQKHNVLLFDEQRERLLLGFEDIRRDITSCDQDFNDAIFYTTVSPFSAVANAVYQPLDNPTDSDKDGVTDIFDEFPNDPTRIFSNFYPAEGVFGSLAFEDLWPHKGDYDFNDLVVDYNFRYEINAQNEITAIRTKYVTRAIGASYHNAFGIEFNTSPSNVSSVTGQYFSQSFLDIASNGTENNQSKAVVIFFDDAFNVLPYSGEGVCVNTYENQPFVIPDTVELEIIFNTPVSFNSLGTPPYNPFIIVNRERGKEVHLPDYAPTDLVDESYFGTGDDNSDPMAGIYYRSKKYLPWGMNLPASFEYPVEKEEIRGVHLKFNDWATSYGYNYTDWYEAFQGYRNTDKIYKNK